MRMRRLVPGVMLAGLAFVATAAPARAQVAFEQVTRDLANPDAGARLNAVRLLKDAAYPEAAAPLAALITDPVDQVQVEAMAAELNIFLVEKVTSRKRVALVVEVRNRVGADAAFSAGPLAIGAQRVPPAVLVALRSALRDESPLVAVTAAYTLGTLGVQASGAERRDLLAALAPELAAMTGSPDAARRYVAVRVAGRLFAPRVGDGPVDTALGDAVILALNDDEKGVRLEAMHALGALRYERAVQALSELFQYYGRGDLGDAALDAVARIGHATGVPTLTAQLSARSAALRGIAVEGLARTGDKAHLPAIEAAVQGERDAALALTATFARVALGTGAMDGVIDALSQPKLREQARGYLVHLAPTHAAQLTRVAQDPDATRRADLADIAALAADPRLQSVVETLLKDPDARVRTAAGRAQLRLSR